MYRSLFLLLILFSLSVITVSGQDPQFLPRGKKIVIQYDSAKNVTLRGFDKMVISGNYPTAYNVSISAFLTHPGQQFVKPLKVLLVFKAVNYPGDRWELSSKKELNIEADGKNWNYLDIKLNDSSLNGSYVGNIASTKVIEYLSVFVNYDDFVAIANSKKVELKLGDRNYRLTKEHIEVLRELANKTN